jgi:hypothetical protein
MNLIGYQQVFASGCAGGLVLELLHWYNLRTNINYPAYVRSAFYWIITAAMVACGGLLALFYFGNKADAIVAFHVGLSAPLILQKLTRTVAKPPPGAKSGLGSSTIDFFGW